ncbi:MAG: DUF819 family protein [Bacteroidetes bacterium]|nr:MAG: DUF819 family protein [Bacteroidota bacterium]
MVSDPLIQNDAVVLGLLLGLLALIFVTAQHPARFWRVFYRFFPPLLLCYFLPALLNSTGIVSGADSGLYHVASRYLLPSALALLCLQIDLPGLRRLGPKALIMFLTASFGVILGGPLSLWLVMHLFPGWLDADPDLVWRGLATIAGSWIGGGANQVAMKEIFAVPEDIYSSMLIVDVTVQNIWMAVLLYGAAQAAHIDRRFRADASAIADLQRRIETRQAAGDRIPTLRDELVLLAVGFGATAVAHFGSDLIVPRLEPYAPTLADWGLNSLLSGFFWLVVIATTIGLGLSFTRARALEHVGAARWASLFIYLLVATIGMKMDIGEIFRNLELFAVGLVWMAFHALLLLGVGRLIRAPFFFLAVGSQANIGGAASAPIVASAFSPALAPVGALMAVLGYALGTYGALLCAGLMRWIATGG